jgi:hypothetical protein
MVKKINCQSTYPNEVCIDVQFVTETKALHVRILWSLEFFISKSFASYLFS